MGPLNRIENWPTRLEAAIMAARDTPFLWGKNDCALFVCGCIAAMTGHDFAAGFRGKYKSAKGARLQLLKRGADDLESYASLQLGVTIARGAAGRGDVASIDTTEGPALGIIDNTGLRIAFVGPEGLTFHPLSAARNIWKV